jgi:hypothetical protein
MKIILNAIRLAAAAIVLAAAPANAGSDAGGYNHYILECGGQCQKLTSTGAIGPGFTGAWFDPAQTGHGLFIEVLADNRIQAAWFTFNPSGSEQAWFIGEGTYAGNTATLTAVTQPSGGRWIPNFDPKHIVANSWGSLTLTFTSCDQGRVEFTSTQGYGAGGMNLTRLTQPAGLTCP